MKLPIDVFSASLGLPMTPKIRFLKQKVKGKASEELSLVQESTVSENLNEDQIESFDTGKDEKYRVDAKEDRFLLLKVDTQRVEKVTDIGDAG